MASSSSWQDPHEWVDPSAAGSNPSGPEALGHVQFEWVSNDTIGIDRDQYASWDGDTWVGDVDESAEVSNEEAERNMVGILVDKLNSGKLHATDICKLCYWAKGFGAKYSVADLAKPPGLGSSKYNRHLEHVLGLDCENDTVQHLKVPCSDAADGSRTFQHLPVIPPHEQLNQEISEHPELAEALADEVRRGGLPPMYTEHPVAIASNFTAQPAALYVDGLPTTKRDGVIGFWTYFILSKKRHLCCVVRKQKLCKCGCRGWCTLWPIMAWLHWSLVAMAIKAHPLKTWGDLDITDAIRLGVAGSELLFSAALSCIKGDWAEFCSTFGFATWQSKRSPCYGCWCTKANMTVDVGFGPGSPVWPEFTFEDYLEACEKSEVFAVVRTVEVLTRLRSALWYDRRKQGKHGRVLRWGMPGLHLLEGDRLEPSVTVRDVGLIDTLGRDALPLTLTFWRVTQDRVKHRNPLYDATIGVTPKIMATDQLHALNLGVLLKFSRELTWAMFWNGVWCTRAGKTQEEHLDLNVISLRSELTAWEVRYERDHPLHKSTRIQKLTKDHFGTVAQRCLKIKAAESKYYFYFLHFKIQTVSHVLNQGPFWLLAANSMCALLRAIERMPWNLSAGQVQD